MIYEQLSLTNVTKHENGKFQPCDIGSRYIVTNNNNYIYSYTYTHICSASILMVILGYILKLDTLWTFSIMVRSSVNIFLEPFFYCGCTFSFSSTNNSYKPTIHIHTDKHIGTVYTYTYIHFSVTTIYQYFRLSLFILIQNFVSLFIIIL